MRPLFRNIGSYFLRRPAALIVGSEVARLRAGHRPPLKLYVQFSRIQLSRKHKTARYGPGPPEWGQHRTCQVGPVRQSPRTMMYGFFPKGTDPPHRPYSSDFPSLPSCLRLPPSPTHSCRRLLGHTAFTALEVLFGSPTTDRASLPISLSLIGSLIPILPGNSASPPEVTRRSSIPCRPQTPWCGG